MNEYVLILSLEKNTKIEKIRIGKKNGSASLEFFSCFPFLRKEGRRGKWKIKINSKKGKSLIFSCWIFFYFSFKKSLKRDFIPEPCNFAAPLSKSHAHKCRQIFRTSVVRSSHRSRWSSQFVQRLRCSAPQWAQPRLGSHFSHDVETAETELDGPALHDLAMRWTVTAWSRASHYPCPIK